MHEANLPPPPPVNLPEPPPSAYFAHRGFDPGLCPTCYKYFLKREQLRNHIVRTCKISSAAKLSKLLPLTLHRSPHGGFYQSPLRTFLTVNRLLFAKRQLFYHGPMPPDASAPVKNIRTVEKMEYFIHHRPIAITHMKYHHRMTHAGHNVAAAAPAPSTDDTATTQTTTRPATAPRIQVCPSCSRALSAIFGLLYHVRTHHLDIASLRVIDERGSPKCIPGSSQATPVHDVCRSPYQT
jgi:hypothetical protein